MIRSIRSLTYVVLAGVLAATGAACSKTTEAEATKTAKTTGRPPVAVTAAPVGLATLEESVEVVGTLEPKFSADVKSEVSGIVTGVYVTEWVPVKRGARLARLDTSETEAGIEALKAGEAQAKVAEARAKREYERAQQLKQFGLITPQAFDEAKTAVEAAEAGTAAARAQIRAAEARLTKSFLVAPMDGVVALRGVNVGDRVESMGGGQLFRIVDNRVLDLTVSVPSSRLALVKVGQPLTFSTDALPGRTFTGKVMFINPEIDQATRAAKVVAQVNNTDGALKSGAFVRGRIVVAQREGVLQVPREALLNWDLERNSAEVFVVTGEQVDKRTVTTGATSGTTVEIVTGVKSGDQVVTRGGFALRPGDRVAVTKGEGA